MTRHILILGGHGKIAQLLTPLLLRKSWTVTSIIRTAEQTSTIEGLATGNGKLNVLVRSLEDVREVPQAKAILDEVKPDSIVWTAGAGGKGPAERTFAVDRDAATCFIKAAVDSPSISKLVLISYLACRRASPSWWDADSWEYVKKVHVSSLAEYCEAKLQADEALVQEASRRSDLAAISLRPGMLTDAPSGGIELGKTRSARGNISRASVAETISGLLDNGDLGTSWLDLLDGEEDVATAVDLVARGKVDASEGEKTRLG